MSNETIHPTEGTVHPHQPPTSGSPSRVNRLASSLVAGLFGAFGGGAIAWATYAGDSWIAAGAAIGFLLFGAYAWVLFYPILMQPYDAFTHATGPDAPSGSWQAIGGALRRQREFMLFDALWHSPRGAVIGAAIGLALAVEWGGTGWVWLVLGGVVGLVLWVLLDLALTAMTTSTSILLVRKLGVLGYALLGGGCGVVFGLALSQRWGHGWSPLWAVAVAVPLALLGGLAGWQRLHWRVPNSSSNALPGASSPPTLPNG